MSDLTVEVTFKNILIGGTTSGIATPVDVFNVTGWIFEIDLNGVPQAIGNPGGGEAYFQLTDRNGGRWKIAADETGVLTKELQGYFGGARTFKVVSAENDAVWMIGIDVTGEFESFYLE
jgi:hypothetical protein